MVKRFPVQIGSWKISKGAYSAEGLLEVVTQAIRNALEKAARPGILLSGGLDSTFTAILTKEQFPGLRCFVLGGSPNHPDVIAAQKLAEELDLNVYTYLPSKAAISAAKARIGTNYRGDEAVLLALEFAAHYVSDILATDGIDEQMGGYWWHINKNERFPRTETAFRYFWDEIESAHLMPMFESAKMAGVNIDWVYLHPEVRDYIAKIPFHERISGGKGKVFWRKVGLMAGVPEWVIERSKRGFCDALI